MCLMSAERFLFLIQKSILTGLCLKSQWLFGGDEDSIASGEFQINTSIKKVKGKKRRSKGKSFVVAT